jgi:hypothetical protein
MLKGLQAAVTNENGFELKNVEVELLPSGSPAVASLSLAELEALRDRPVIPASKHALETICGASCETGAQ